MPMAAELFAQIMREIARDSDKEGRHAEADIIMCAILTELGYGEGIKIFQDMDKWYA